MKQVLIAGLLGGIAVFIWSGISWMVLPWHNMTMGTLSNEAEVVEMLRGGENSSGVYFFPGFEESIEDEAAEKEWIEKHRQGPLGFLFYHAEGKEPMEASVFILGIIFNILSSMVIAYMLYLGVNQMPGYTQRVLFVTLAGVFAALVSHISMWIWFYAPTGYTLVNTADMIITWLLAGLVIAWRIKPNTVAAS